MSLYPEQLDDLVNLTFDREHKREWTDISLTNQFYIFVEKFLRGQRKTPVKGGTRMSWTVQVEAADTFQWTSMYHVDETEAKNLSAKGKQEWAMCTANMSYDVNEEEFQGDETTLIVEEILMRENAMHNNWATKLEQALWSAPSSDSLEQRPLSGIPFWVQKNATQGFNGGDPSGFSSGAGQISTSTYANWKNYTDTYDVVSRGDLISKMLRMCDFTNFRPPHAFPDLNKLNRMPDMMLFTTWDLYDALAGFLDSRNDNLRDLSGLAGSLVFKGAPIWWVPELTHSGNVGYDSTDPIYFINWRNMHLFFQAGKEMERTPPIRRDRQHNVRTVYLDSALNMYSTNRRGNGVIYNA